MLTLTGGLYGGALTRTGLVELPFAVGDPLVSEAESLPLLLSTDGRLEAFFERRGIFFFCLMIDDFGNLSAQ